MKKMFKMTLAVLLVLIAAAGTAAAIDGEVPQAQDDFEDDLMDPEDMLGDEEIPEQPGFGVIVAIMGLFAAAVPAALRRR
ncbi:hypothetical protein Mzhil_0195 [Methanosalsum zhilinae DSM 4017]|uniref:PGF-CTERM archaeal protein-sorting signal domain-containing protein n=1 Tax=Methanosalsum zhilinae (strain DSM 4017 / NBRC 107636 / OCM 62 / WeN5) TaxID=679901 RepID=F7XL63_METZD|nr:PGF-CTERM sorting domain-containing protein [Methanosalsum zhilinae]AEH60074.1 hypothetical protein Mzhil_0195 [Methanosalsum zhilinae DSM 4017]